MLPERILIVDDDEAMLHMMAFSLRRINGYQIETATSGYEALDVMQSRGSFAILLTDLMMPGMSGIELMQAAHKIDPHLASIVITAAGTIESAITALRDHGAYDYLLKPLESMNQLALTVERALNHRRLLIERQELQTSIQIQAERLQALITYTGDAIISADGQGILTIANPAAERLLNRQWLVGKPAAQGLPPSLSGLIDNWQAVGARHPAIIEVPWQDGSVQMVNLSPLVAGTGQPNGWVIVMRDITHFKNMDKFKTRMLTQAIDRIQLPLAHAVNVLTELNLLATQDERLADIAYRLNKAWGTIQSWGDGLTGLVETRQPQDIKFEEIELKTMLTDIQHELLRDILRDSGVKLNIISPPDLPKVHADPLLLSQLLVGLIRRANSRSKKGDTIRVQARQHKDQVWLDVRDQGPAIQDADLPHVFEKSFFDLQEELLNSGIELSTVKPIAEQMGGQVWVGGDGPIGSTISVCLPLPPPS